MVETESGRILADAEKARQQRQTKDDLWKELDQFDRGEQWKNAGIPKWVPKPVTNYVHLVKTTKTAALSIKNPTGMLRAISPHDVENIRHLQKVYEYAWDKSNSKYTAREALATSSLLGTGIIQTYWEEETPVKGGKDGFYEGEICTEEIDPSIFYPDPSAYRIEDCRFIHIVQKKPLIWLKKHPRFKDKMAGVQSRNLSDQEVGDIYVREDNATTDTGMIDFRQHFEKYRNNEGGWNYKVTYMAGEKIIHTIDPLKPNCYPFAAYYSYRQRKDFWGKGDCELILENQKVINKVESIIALIGTQLQNPQTIVHKMSGINPREVGKYGSAPGKVWESNIPVERAMTWRQPAQIPPALFSLAETAAANIREITGMTEAYMGQSVGSLQTSSGVNMLIDRATLRDRDQMIDYERFIEDHSRVLIQFATAYYETPRYIRKEENPTEETTEDSFSSFRGSDFRGTDFDFYIDVSAKAPITRQRQKEEANQLLTIQGQYGFDPSVITPQEYIRQSELINSAEIIQRMNRDEFQSKAQLLQSIVMMANEALQKNVPEEEVAKMSLQMLQQKLAAKEEGVGSANTGAQQAQAAQPMGG